MCTVNIDSVGAQVIGGNVVVEIDVSGTASTSECDSVEVTVTCVGGVNPPMQAVVPVDKNSGDWSATFTKGIFDLCSCGQEVAVHVQCLGPSPNPSVPGPPVAGCAADWGGELQCKPACPDINWLLPQPNPDCNPDGTRKIANLGAVVTNPFLPVIVADLEWIEGNVVLVPPTQGNGVVNLGPVAPDLPPGVQTLHVSVTTPTGCGGSDLKVNVAACAPVGACCLPPAGTGLQPCEVMTQAECEAQGGKYLGDGTTCQGDPCGSGMQPNGPPGQPTCGDGLIVAAALALGMGLFLLIISHCCVFPPQIQAILLIAAGILIVLSGLLLGIWVLLSFLLKCKLDWCQAAKIFLKALAATSGLVLLWGFLTFLIEGPAWKACDCVWVPGTLALAGFVALWGGIAASCIKKP